MPVIWVRTKAEYFRFRRLTRFLKIRSDLPVSHYMAAVGWAKRKRAHHQAARSTMDGGHVAYAPLPTLQLYATPPPRLLRRELVDRGAELATHPRLAIPDIRRVPGA
jgi:hypothetical protein